MPPRIWRAGFWLEGECDSLRRPETCPPCLLGVGVPGVRFAAFPIGQVRWEFCGCSFGGASCGEGILNREDRQGVETGCFETASHFAKPSPTRLDISCGDHLGAQNSAGQATSSVRSASVSGKVRLGGGCGWLEISERHELQSLLQVQAGIHPAMDELMLSSVSRYPML